MIRHNFSMYWVLNLTFDILKVLRTMQSNDQDHYVYGFVPSPNSFW